MNSEGTQPYITHVSILPQALSPQAATEHSRVPGSMYSNASPSRRTLWLPAVSPTLSHSWAAFSTIFKFKLCLVLADDLGWVTSPGWAFAKSHLPTWQGLYASSCPNSSSQQMNSHSAPGPITQQPHCSGWAPPHPSAGEAGAGASQASRGRGDSRAWRAPPPPLQKSLLIRVAMCRENSVWSLTLRNISDLSFLLFMLLTSGMSIMHGIPTLC